MKFKQQVLYKHIHGITAQWMAEDNSSMVVATYQLDSTKRYVMVNCNGPWDDGKVDGYESQRVAISGEAVLILSIINTENNQEALDKAWSGLKIGF